MSYIQLNEDGTFLREVYGDVQEWDEKNYCGVDSLVRDGKAEQFRVYPLVRTEQPAFARQRWRAWIETAYLRARLALPCVRPSAMAGVD